MRYATAYDVGDRKRESDGINEDSIEVAVFEDGHREGYIPSFDQRTISERTQSSQDADVTAHGPGDKPVSTPSSSGTSNKTEIFAGDTGDGPRNRKAGVFVLADGAGGEESGDIASYIATVRVAQELTTFLHEALLARSDDFDLDFAIEDGSQVFDDPYSDATYENAIQDAIASANEDIVKQANVDDVDGMYTTLVAGIYFGDQFHYGWVGDSRIYVINQSHEEIAPLTKDHAKITRLEDEGEIGEVEAHVHPDGNQIERALGGRAGDDPGQSKNKTYDLVETNTIKLYSDDAVLLTSDGLIDAQTDYRELYRKYIGSGRDDEVAQEILEKVVTDDLVRDVVLDAESLQSAADEFISISNKKGGKDNISVILFADEYLPDSPPAEESGLPERSIDPDMEVAERQTIIRDAD